MGLQFYYAFSLVAVLENTFSILLFSLVAILENKFSIYALETGASSISLQCV